MLDFFSKIENLLIWCAGHFSVATTFILVIFSVSVYLFRKADKNPNSPIRAEDLFLDVTTNKINPYKVGYCIGILVSTWVTITLTDAGKLTLDIFGSYLLFLLGGSGVSSYMRSRNMPIPDSPPPDAVPGDEQPR